MKRIFMLVMAVLLVLPAAFAQSNRSTLRIRLNDGSPLMVTINGRNFRKVGRSITIGDLPGKRQYLEVYKYRQFADGNGGRPQLVFSGKIKIVKGSTYDCVVNVEDQQLRVLQVASLQPLAETPAFNRNLSEPLDQQSNGQQMQNGMAANDAPLAMPATQTVASNLLPLKKSMDKVDADSKKLSLALAYVNNNAVSTQDITAIANWMFFDDSKLKFVKQAYPKVMDKNNYASVVSIFTLDDSKKQFDNFLKQQ